MDIPPAWDSASPAWMTKALADAFPDAEVSAVRVVGRDDGGHTSLPATAASTET